MATTGTTSARTQEGRTWHRLAVAAVLAAFLWGMGLVASSILLPDATTSKVVAPTSYTPIQGHVSPASPTYPDGRDNRNPVQVRMSLPHLRPRFG